VGGTCAQAGVMSSVSGRLVSLYFGLRAIVPCRREEGGRWTVMSGAGLVRMGVREMWFGVCGRCILRRHSRLTLRIVDIVQAQREARGRHSGAVIIALVASHKG
jgi:hypothetical protein